MRALPEAMEYILSILPPRKILTNQFFVYLEVYA
jgi:hypothetical protein